MLTPDDAVVLRRVGRDFIKLFVANVFETIFIAVYALLVGKTGTLLLCRETRTRASLCLCTAVFLMFGLALSLWIIDIHTVVVEVQTTLLSHSFGSPQEAYSAALSRILGMAAIEDVLYAYMTIIGDSIIIWRVYALWSRGSMRRRLVILLPITLLLGSMACSMMLTYCATRLGSDIVLGTYQNPAFCRQIQTMSYCTTLVTTGVATLLVAYTTWEARRTWLDVFGTLSPQTRTQRVMLILVESGVLYTLFFLVQVLVSLKSINERINSSEAATFALTMYQFVTSVIVGMYPTVIVILVKSKYSVLEVHTVQGSFDATSAGVISARSRRTKSNSTAFIDIRASSLEPTSDLSLDLYEMGRMETSDTKGENMDPKV